MTTGRISVGRDRPAAAREPLEVAWEREHARIRGRTSEAERVAGRVAGGLLLGVLLGSWLDLSLATFLMLLLATMVAWIALCRLVDRFEGRRPAP